MDPHANPQPDRHRTPAPTRLWRHKGNLLLLALVGLVLYVQWPMLKGLFYRTTGAQAVEGNIAWRTDLDAALAEARQAGKPVLVDFTASWCPPCQVMKHDVWPDAEVGKLANGSFVPVLIDVDADNATASRYGIRTIPTILVLDADGREVRRASFMSRSAMVAFLRDAGAPGGVASAAD